MNDPQKHKVLETLGGAYAALETLLATNDPELKAMELEGMARETLESISEITKKLCLNGVKSFLRGHPVVYDGRNWRYVDTGEIAGKKLQDTRPCARCGKSPTPEGHDACLGELEGIKSACCGHGVEKPFKVMENKRGRP